jgi:predicted Zn-ribbon and HTH transcriptional regulator
MTTRRDKKVECPDCGKLFDVNKHSQCPECKKELKNE